MIDMRTMNEAWLMLMQMINLGLCAGVTWACVCRIAVMSRQTTKPHFRTLYTLVSVAACGSGFSHLWWGEWAGPGQIGGSLAMLYWAWAGLDMWRDGPPDYVLSAPVELEGAVLPGVVGGRKS